MHMPAVKLELVSRVRSCQLSHVNPSSPILSYSTHSPPCSTAFVLPCLGGQYMQFHKVSQTHWSQELGTVYRRH